MAETENNTQDQPANPDAWLRHYPYDDFFTNCPYPATREESDEIDIDLIESRVQQLMADCDVSKGFCSRCRYLLNHWPDLDSRTDWEYAVGQTYSTEEIEASSRSGCNMCSFLWSRLLLSNRLYNFRRVEARLAALDRPNRCSLSIQNWGKSSKSQLIWLNLPGVQDTHCNNTSANVVQFQSNRLQITSKCWEEPLDPIELAKSWISQCRDSHQDCRPVWKREGPRRLIGIADDTVRLVESDSWDEIPEYATLSYSWGRVPFTKLTRETFSSFLQEIPLESLPQTFQDAIRLARALGLSFIWIDALCIIQDSEGHTDWLTESGRMNLIYGGSQVTFSASSAQDAFQGFFPTTTPKYHGGFVTRLQTSKQGRVHNFYSSRVYQESTKETHLGGRGWALQEKLLSRRTLHIGDHGVFWECQSTMKSQFIPERFAGLTAQHRLVRPENKEWDWREILNIYSETSLTLESDRLPALSGIAARQNAITGDRYLAGIWKNDIVAMLTWVCSAPLATRPTWRAPTWSWASIEGASITTYTNAGEDMKPLARLVDAWTKAVSDSPFGAVSDGQITLACASLIRAKLDRTGIEGYCYPKCEVRPELLGSKEQPHLIFDGFESLTFSVSLDCLDEEMQGKQEDVIVLPLFGGFSGSAMGASEHAKRDEPKSGIEAAAAPGAGVDGLRLLDLEAATSDMEGEFFYDSDGDCFQREKVIEGIVLRVTPGFPGHYTRLGQFSFNNSPGYFGARNFYDEMSSIIRAQGAAAVRSRCIRADAHPMQKYVIKIK
ncbi:unnamed protein product [Clonostachys rosea]|uniref:Heterokaryon incompatibility domain-containing protein n=1 Tax=Bionectria ochroleuca TaxID=29856 RepID=A0ABY6V3S7_BIOOC|nr:unnamed protein product [Clonostachys rosea]